MLSGAIILSHGRPECRTIESLKRHGYTGPIVILLDTDDATTDRYYEAFEGDPQISIEIFDKRDVPSDSATSPARWKVPLYGRNYSFALAKKLGWDVFVLLDDDYTAFSWYKAGSATRQATSVRNLDRAFDHSAEFVKATGAVLAWAQTGDYIGGSVGGSSRRKAMNTFFLRADDPFEWVGEMNDDVNTYLVEGSRGRVFLTTFDILIEQNDTQTNAGGMTDAYKDAGTYAKSYTSVLYAPSCVEIERAKAMSRVHHRIQWKYAVPKILNCK